MRPFAKSLTISPTLCWVADGVAISFGIIVSGTNIVEQLLNRYLGEVKPGHRARTAGQVRTTHPKKSNTTSDMKSRPLTIRIPNGATVSALLLNPQNALSCFVFAHGAGAGMDDTFMEEISVKLATVKIATLRYQFPYMEAHSRRPDRPAACHAAVRAAVGAAGKELPKMPLLAGGKSFGGRMTSQAQALAPLPGVAGLAFFGFPWHPPKVPSLKRSEHLAEIHIPMIFMQGARDALGEPNLVEAQIHNFREVAVLHAVPEADHGFHVLVRSGRTDADVQDDLVRVFAEWAGSIK